MNSLREIFSYPFELINVEESDINIQYPHVRFEYETKEIINGNSTMEEAYILSKPFFNDFIRKYKNSIFHDKPIAFSTYAIYVAFPNDYYHEYKKLFSVYIDNTKDNVKNEDKYVDNKEITGNFLIYLEITLYIDPSLKEDNCEIKKYIPEDECVICYENKPNILYTDCLHFVVCKDCDNNGNFSKCPLCRKKIKSGKIYFPNFI